MVKKIFLEQVFHVQLLSSSLSRKRVCEHFHVHRLSFCI